MFRCTPTFWPAFLPGCLQSSLSDSILPGCQAKADKRILFPQNKTFLADNIALFIFDQMEKYHRGTEVSAKNVWGDFYLWHHAASWQSRKKFWKLTLSQVEFQSWILIQFLARKCQENCIKSFEFQILQDLFNFNKIFMKVFKWISSVLFLTLRYLTFSKATCFGR